MNGEMLIMIICSQFMWKTSKAADVKPLLFSRKADLWFSTIPTLLKWRQSRSIGAGIWLPHLKAQASQERYRNNPKASSHSLVGQIEIDYSPCGLISAAIPFYPKKEEVGVDIPGAGGCCRRWRSPRTQSGGLVSPRRRSGWTSPSPRRRRASPRSRRGCLLCPSCYWRDSGPIKVQLPKWWKDDNGSTTQFAKDGDNATSNSTWILIQPQSPDSKNCRFRRHQFLQHWQLLQLRNILINPYCLSAAYVFVPPPVPWGKRPKGTNYPSVRQCQNE